MTDSTNAERTSRLSLATGWKAYCPGGQKLLLTPATTQGRTKLRLEYDFCGEGGFVIARNVWPRAMPDAFKIRLRLKVAGSKNDLELKLIDPSNRNVWRHTTKALAATSRWHWLVIDSRDIGYAWGPAGGGAITELGAIELGLVANEGGAGTIQIAAIELLDLGYRDEPRCEVSSGSAKADPAAVQWQPSSDDAAPTLNLDFGARRRLGGLTLHWSGAAPQAGFEIAIRQRGRWRRVYQLARAGGGRSDVYLPNAETTGLRIRARGAIGGLRLVIQPQAFSSSIEAFWHAIAADTPRGWHPRWLHRQQCPWTAFGNDAGPESALLNVDGAVEPDEGGVTIEPMLALDGRLLSWADVKATPTLPADGRPEPGVVWRGEGWRLVIETEAGRSGIPRLRYRFHNELAAPRSVRLFLLVRPFQVTPPWQQFRNVGGVRPIHRLRFKGSTLQIDERGAIEPLTAPSACGAAAFGEGLLPELLAGGRMPAASQVEDPFGFASAAFAFDLVVAPGAAAEAAIAYRRSGVDAPIDEPAFNWQAALAGPTFHAAGNGADALAALRTAAGHVLIARAGAAIQAGPRRYTRSWIRDGAMMAMALARVGRLDAAEAFARWYAPAQRADGFVPCCVDRDGPDWLVEHDSHGELLALIADVDRFRRDDAFLAAMWPHVVAAVNVIGALREADGLLPISASHEGYLAQPVHSYWDDFWALRGLRDAVRLAQARGDVASATAWQTLADDFETRLIASVAQTRQRAGLDHLPGSVEWADFDPTATANALLILDGLPMFERTVVERTFDAFLEDWRRMRDGGRDWLNYTPYQIRIISAYVRLGGRDAAQELLRDALASRLPRAWNQWPEIAWKDREAPAHLGDLPHCWIAAEYVLAVRSLFVYEDDHRNALVLAAGIDETWLDGEGVRVEDAPTPFGTISYMLRRIRDDELQATIRAQLDTGSQIYLQPPAATLISATVGGAALKIEGGAVVIAAEDAGSIELTIKRAIRV